MIYESSSLHLEVFIDSSFFTLKLPYISPYPPKASTKNHQLITGSGSTRRRLHRKPVQIEGKELQGVVPRSTRFPRLAVEGSWENRGLVGWLFFFWGGGCDVLNCCSCWRFEFRLLMYVLLCFLFEQEDLY